ncbi:molecular chaperone [Haematococcus lacustris]
MSAQPLRVSPYHVLGLPSTATREQVKEAFRRLCLESHPDKCSNPALKSGAEAKFRLIKSAYDTILKGQAGYAPPPPGTAASASYAQAYYKAHHGVQPEGPIKCGGPFGGFATEMDFYRHMFRATRNNPLALLVGGLACIPLISVAVSVANGNTGFIKKFANEGIFMFTQNRFKVNGRETVRGNPFSIRSDSGDHQEQSYIYKSDKFKHLRAGRAAEEAAVPETAPEAA